MRATGIMIKLKGEVLMSILTAPNTSVTGKRIANTVMELKPGQIMPDTKAITSSVRSTEWALSNGLMDHPTSVSSTTITSMERECTLGQTIESTRENGEPTRCTVRAPLLGLMVESTSVSMPRIRRKGTENSSGQMGDATEENGLMESNMEKAPS